jgi:hypothetical protein
MLLPSILLPTLMPSVMSEQTEPSERTANEPPDLLTFTEAAERVNLAA